MPLSPVRSFLFCRLGVAGLFAATFALAQEPAAPSLTLPQALLRAAERNPSLVALGFRERAAQGWIEQAGVRPNPTLEVEADNFVGTGALQGVRALDTTVRTSRVFERGGKREKRIALATRERDSATKEGGLRRVEILAATAAAFVDLLAAQQRVALALDPLRLARETAGAAEARVGAGAASPAESARARAGLASAQGEFARAQADLNASRARLAASWGGTAGEIFTVVGSLQVPEILPTENAFRAKIVGHARLALQQASIATRRAALQLEQAQARQDVTVGAGVRFLRSGSDAGFVAGVSMPIPMPNQNQGNIRAARETLAGAEHEVGVIQAELQVAFAAAWQELTAAHAAAETLRREALPATEEAHAVVRRAYNEGQLPLIDVLDAQRALLGLRRELLAAESAYAAAHARAEALADPTFPATAALLSSR